MSKPRCDYCPATYLSRYTDSEGKTCHKCLAHLPNDIDTDFDRYEHLILNEIKKSLPSSEHYNDKRIISPKYDKGLMKGVRERPDLIIRSPLEGKNIVIVEVDEGYHNKEEQRRLDIEREEFFREKLTEKARRAFQELPSISFVRIEPFDLEDNSIVGKMQKMVISPGKKSKKVIKTGDFEGVLKTSISEIRKKLTRRNSGTHTIKITPDNYRYSFSPYRAPLKSPYSRIFPRRRSTLIRENEQASASNYTEDNKIVQDHIDKIIEWREEQKRNRSGIYASSPIETRKNPISPRKKSLSPLQLPKKTTPPQFPKKTTPPPKKQSNSKPFTKEQKSKISKLLKNGEDYSEYLGSIYGQDYKKSSIKLSSLDPISVHLHVIQGAALGFADSELLKGVEKLRKMSLTTKMPMVKAAKTDLLNRNSEKTSAKSNIASSLKNEISLLESPRKKSLSPPPLPKKASPPRKKSLSPAKKSTGFFGFLGF